MNIKTIKLLIAFFAGLLALFIGLISLNYFDSEPAAPGFSAGATAQRALAEARAGANTREKAPSSFAPVLSPGASKGRGPAKLLPSEADPS